MHTRQMKLRPNGYAPTRTAYKLGAKGGFTAKAWQYAWDRLSADEWRSANEVAQEAAHAFHIKPESVRAQMYAAAKDGYLETELRPVTLTVLRKDKGKTTEFSTTRNATFYRIKKMAEAPAA